MQTEYFDSTTISLILAWVFAIPILLSLVGYSINIIIESFSDKQTIIGIVLIISFLIFSPFRYIIFQVILFSSSLVQSGSGFLSFLLSVFTLFGPIVFIVFYLLGIGLPFLLIALIGGLYKEQERVSKIRIIVATIFSPAIFWAGTHLFFLCLPFVGYTTIWLSAEDGVRASNGPAWVYYKTIGSHLMPIQHPTLDSKYELDNRSQYRNHVAYIYLDETQYKRYLKKAYPDLNLAEDENSTYQYTPDFDLEDIIHECFSYLSYVSWDELYEEEFQNDIRKFSNYIDKYYRDDKEVIMAAARTYVYYNVSLEKDFEECLINTFKTGKFEFIQSESSKRLETEALKLGLEEEVKQGKAMILNVSERFSNMNLPKDVIKQAAQNLNNEMKELSRRQYNDFNLIYFLLFGEELGLK